MSWNDGSASRKSARYRLLDRYAGSWPTPSPWNTRVPHISTSRTMYTSSCGTAHEGRGVRRLAQRATGGQAWARCRATHVITSLGHEARVEAVEGQRCGCGQRRQGTRRKQLRELRVQPGWCRTRWCVTMSHAKASHVGRAAICTTPAPHTHLTNSLYRRHTVYECGTSPPCAPSAGGPSPMSYPVTVTAYSTYRLPASFCMRADVTAADSSLNCAAGRASREEHAASRPRHTPCTLQPTRPQHGRRTLNLRRQPMSPPGSCTTRTTLSAAAPAPMPMPSSSLPVLEPPVRNAPTAHPANRTNAARCHARAHSANGHDTIQQWRDPTHLGRAAAPGRSSLR